MSGCRNRARQRRHRHGPCEQKALALGAAFTRQEITRSRVTLYRGVYPVAYDVTDKGEAFYFSIFRLLLDLKLVAVGDSIILTKA